MQGREDVPLNARGQEQARLTAAFLADRRWDAVISSPLARAMETARIIADRLAIADVTRFEEFTEKDYGAAAGLSPIEREAQLPNGVWPGLESRESVTARCRRGLRLLEERYPGRRVVVVSHGAAINAILALLSGGKIGTGKTELDNACISTLLFRNRCWHIESSNSVSHLGAIRQGEHG